MQKLVYWTDQRQLNWMLLDHQGQQAQIVQSGSLLEGELLPDSLAQLRHQCLLLPGTEVGLKTLNFSPAERRHILKTVPYLLEDALPVDSEELIIECAKPDSNSVLVAYCDREWLQQYTADFSRFNLQPSQVIPEQVFFANLIEQGNYLVIDNRVLLQLENQVLCFEQNQLDLVLQTDGEAANLATVDKLVEDDQQAQIERPPQTNSILLMPGSELDPSLSALGLAEEILSTEAAFDTRIDFVNYGFGARVQWGELFRFARPVLIAASIAAILLTTVLWLEQSGLNQQNLDLRRGIEQEFRQVQAKGAVYQPISKMKQMLAAYGAAQSGGFSEVFNKVAQPLASQQDMQIQSVNWDGKNAELKLELIVADFNALQKLQKDIVAQSLKVELQNSNAQGDKLQARLKVRGAG